MRLKKIAPIVVLVLICAGCTSEKPDVVTNPLVGVWEIVAGEYHMQDTTVTIPNHSMPDFKSIKFFSENYFNTTGTDGNPDGKFWSFSGTYVIDGDEYTQTQIINRSGEKEKKQTMKFKVEGDTLYQESDWHNEVWIRLE